ncbi:MAG: fasciclin domain-containing protein [Candidatus Thalassarchaeaceae archaeon]
MNTRMIMPIIIGMYVTFTIGAMSLSPIVAAEETDDIPTNAQNTGEHDALVAALSHADLVSALQGEGPFTVFAPTDAAFAAAGIDLASFDTDEENATLVDILTYHVYSGSVESSAVTDGLTVTMLNGDDATFTVANGTVSIGDAVVTAADVMASNGIIHVIDKVLMPPAPVTVDDGDICYNLYTHTISAGASFEECVAYAYYVDFEMNGQTFTGCYNMVTHALTTVSQEECESYVWTPAVDIAMTASATTIHASLVAALAQADLVSALQGEGPFTVFAPTDAAFAAAGIDLASFDTDEENATLVDILTYHVYSGSVESSAVTDGLTVTMLNGDDATFTVANGTVSIGDATVTLADVPASNGVIHVIDKVLMPPADLPTIPEGCDYVIGIDDTGLAYDNTELAIEVGETVCWIWEDESMAHNVAEISEEGDTMRMIGGDYSGESVSTIDYRLTFTEDETFHYICEPHATMGMAGKVTVGTGVREVTTPEPVYEEENNTPGFTVLLLGVAAISAVVLSGRRW